MFSDGGCVNNGLNDLLYFLGRFSKLFFIHTLFDVLVSGWT